MFTFGFDTSAPENTPSGNEGASSGCLHAMCEHSPSELEAETDGWPSEDYGFELQRLCMPPSRHEQLLGGIVGAEAAGTSDLVGGEYEGGFKVWECAHDLMLALTELCQNGQLQLAGASVLEAGCGAGLPGALALRLGCSSLLLQDFNSEVRRTPRMRTESQTSVQTYFGRPVHCVQNVHRDGLEQTDLRGPAQMLCTAHAGGFLAGAALAHDTNSEA